MDGLAIMAFCGLVALEADVAALVVITILANSSFPAFSENQRRRAPGRDERRRDHGVLHHALQTAVT
jgi:hypothetical protein